MLHGLLLQFVRLREQSRELGNQELGKSTRRIEK